ncbi:MAG: hypothetical protein R3F31_07910 [Verrucomicrobiales bacterium]
MERKKVDGFLNGKAVLREIRVFFTANESGPGMDLLVVTPAGRKSSPAFLGLNFQGNHSVHPSPEISLPQSWMRPNAETVVENRATEKGRGAAASRWPIEMIIDHGFALATAYYGDIDPDFDDGWFNGVHPCFTNPTNPAGSGGMGFHWRLGLGIEPCSRRPGKGPGDQCPAGGGFGALAPTEKPPSGPGLRMSASRW